VIGDGGWLPHNQPLHGPDGRHRPRDLKAFGTDRAPVQRPDDYIFKGWEHERKVDVTKKVIADATGWDRENDKYQRVMGRLMRDLAADRAKSA
jgi:hypothetical protein